LDPPHFGKDRTVPGRPIGEVDRQIEVTSSTPEEFLDLGDRRVEQSVRAGAHLSTQPPLEAADEGVARCEDLECHDAAGRRGQVDRSPGRRYGRNRDGL
jgi:hypothetical protein